jgi:hypothetical protein
MMVSFLNFSVSVRLKILPGLVFSIIVLLGFFSGSVTIIDFELHIKGSFEKLSNLKLSWLMVSAITLLPDVSMLLSGGNGALSSSFEKAPER